MFASSLFRPASGLFEQRYKFPRVAAQRYRQSFTATLQRYFIPEYRGCDATHRALWKIIRGSAFPWQAEFGCKSALRRAK
jgi:hypothetical protein